MRYLVLWLLTGCVSDHAPHPSAHVPLAQLAGGLDVVLFGGDLLLSVSSADCVGIESAVTATLSGTPPNAIEIGSRSPTGQCTRPQFIWPVSAGVDAGTFVVTDGITTWTFETASPGQERQLAFVSPTGNTIHPGEHVVVGLDPPGGTMSDAYAFALGLFDLDETSGVTATDASIEFDTPTVTGDATLVVGARVGLPVIACTAPAGCSAWQQPDVTASVTFR